MAVEIGGAHEASFLMVGLMVVLVSVFAFDAASSQAPAQLEDLQARFEQWASSNVDDDGEGIPNDIDSREADVDTIFANIHPLVMIPLEWLNDSDPFHETYRINKSIYVETEQSPPDNAQDMGIPVGCAIRFPLKKWKGVEAK